MNVITRSNRNLGRYNRVSNTFNAARRAETSDSESDEDSETVKEQLQSPIIPKPLLPFNEASILMASNITQLPEEMLLYIYGLSFLQLYVSNSKPLIFPTDFLTFSELILIRELFNKYLFEILAKFLELCERIKPRSFLILRGNGIIQNAMKVPLKTERPMFENSDSPPPNKRRRIMVYFSLSQSQTRIISKCNKTETSIQSQAETDSNLSKLCDLCQLSAASQCIPSIRSSR